MAVFRLNVFFKVFLPCNRLRTQPGKAPIASGLFHACRCLPCGNRQAFLWPYSQDLCLAGWTLLHTKDVPKSFNATSAKHFWGIMLSPSVAKRLLPCWEPQLWALLNVSNRLDKLADSNTNKLDSPHKHSLPFAELRSIKGAVLVPCLLTFQMHSTALSVN